MPSRNRALERMDTMWCDDLERVHLVLSFTGHCRYLVLETNIPLDRGLPIVQLYLTSPPFSQCHKCCYSGLLGLVSEDMLLASEIPEPGATIEYMMNGSKARRTNATSH
jgi:hypothetical protein